MRFFYPILFIDYILNTFLKTVRIFGGRWGANSYLDSPKNIKKKEYFHNWPPILVMTCLQCDDKLNFFWKYN